MCNKRPHTQIHAMHTQLQSVFLFVFLLFTFQWVDAFLPWRVVNVVEVISGVRVGTGFEQNLHHTGKEQKMRTHACNNAAWNLYCTDAHIHTDKPSHSYNSVFTAITATYNQVYGSVICINSSVTIYGHLFCCINIYQDIAHTTVCRWSI